MQIAYAERAVVRHRHRTTQRGFFRQQLGWAYGAGLVAAKYHALDGRPAPPPRLRDVVTAARGVGLVAVLRLRRRPPIPFRRAYLEDAWFGLMRQAAWYLGARSGLLRGRILFRREARAHRAEAGRRDDASPRRYPEPPPG